MIKQHRRHIGGGGGHQNPFKWRLFGPAAGAVPGNGGNVRQLHTIKAHLGKLQQFWMTLDGVEPSAQLRQDNRLVAGPRADLKHLVAFRQLKFLRHQADHAWLADSLMVTYGQRHIFKRPRLEGFRQKHVARRPFDGRQDLSIGHTHLTQL